ncbi:MAG: right-handed parallel beta-helix repeat-containing protein [Sandaracinus sp.]|nr:right-handed parallel beta-helix repeat-containing protein [Sandaracinus sp.]
MRSSFVALLLLSSTSPALAETFTAGPGDDVEARINALTPGDELVLADGDYPLDGSRFSFDLTGTEAMPIVIRAAEGARPHFHRPNASQNVWDVRAEYVEIRGLAFSGGSAGLRFEHGRYVTIEGCEIFGTADVALRMNDGGQRYEGMRILRNHIHHTNGTGEGMYLGCNSNGCQLANALIEGNHVHHTNQSSVSQGDGIEIKEGSFGNVVRDNVIHDTKYPCILTYATAGNGAPNVIERNVMWGCGDNAIQSAADATIRNNLILGAGGAGLAMQPHQAGTPSNLVVVHNTILNTGNPIALRGATGSVVIANNALYTGGGTSIFTNGDTSMLVSVGNVGNGSGPGVSAGVIGDLVMASLDGAPPMNLFPRAGGALDGAGDAAHVVTDDFDGNARMGVADVGAYALAAGGPGWEIGEGFKDVDVTPMPGTDGGPADLDASVPGSDAGPVSPGTDAGTSPRADAGTSESGGGGGCSCATGADSRSAWPLVFAFFFARRRRR